MAVPRRICALYDSLGLLPGVRDPVHSLLEMPLNHLGMVVLRHDLRSGPPPEDWLEGARAVLTYFADIGAAPSWLWPWLENEVSRRNLRVIHFGELGPLIQPQGNGSKDFERIRRWLLPFGLEIDPVFEPGPQGIEVQYLDSKLCEFESSALALADYQGPRNGSAANRAWVTTSCDAYPGDPRTPVVTGPWGALALDPWTVKKGSLDDDLRWHLDPFAFFAEALGLKGVPAPHPSVVNGRRMFFLHVDGDGFESLSTVEPGELCAKVFLDEILKRYRIPASVSVIIASLTRDYAVSRATPEMLLASQILNLPSVEPASHSVTHPLRWQEHWSPDPSSRSVLSYLPLNNYQYCAENEVTQSLQFINERLMKDGRRCELMLWSGDTNPSESVLRACRQYPAHNLNGGECRWDPWMDSVGFMLPWGRFVGGEFQVYCGLANENNFEGFFTTMPAAFRKIDISLTRTDGPRILKPANLYVHFYSAERPPRLKALQGLIERWALEKATAPVFASDYSKAVQSAIHGARIHATPQGWRLEDFGECRTARIDGETRDVDFARSKGLLGQRRIGESLYLHLCANDADVVLTEDPPLHPYVEEANHILRDVALAPSLVRFRASAHSRRLVVLAGLSPHQRARIVTGHEQRQSRADERGRLVIEFPEPGDTLVEVHLL